MYSPTWTNPDAPTDDGPLFSGYLFDAESGLYQVRNRYYSPGFSAFIRRDPLTFNAGINLYEYAGDQPNSRNDASGLDFSMYCPAAYPSCSDIKRSAENCMRLNFLAWYEAERQDTAWMDSLPHCPCSIVQNGQWVNPDSGIWNDPRAVTFPDTYHPGAVMELRTRQPNEDGAGQQCTYDEYGRLVNTGYGAGTPDRTWATYNKLVVAWNYLWGCGHIGADVSPFDWAYELDGNQHGHYVDMYLQVRKPNRGKDASGNDCPPNPPETSLPSAPSAPFVMPTPIVPKSPPMR